uniref:Uncharacterized protein n=1 Tax=Rhizophora mucronata TaxID=61149 RepID=A0A2P2NYN8_RHIMU
MNFSKLTNCRKETHKMMMAVLLSSIFCFLFQQKNNHLIA